MLARTTDNLHLSIDFANNKATVPISPNFIELLLTSDYLAEAIIAKTNRKIINDLHKNKKASYNTLEKIYEGVKEFNEYQKTNCKNIKEITLNDIIHFDTTYSIPSSYDFRSLRYGYFSDYYRESFKLNCFWFREIIKFKKGEQTKKNKFKGIFKNERGNQFAFELDQINETHVGFSAKLAKQNPAIGFTGVFLWCVDNVLCGYWIGRDLLNFQPSIFQMIWSPEPLDFSYLAKLISNVKLEAIYGLGSNQKHIKKESKINLSFYDSQSEFFDLNNKF